MPSEVDGFSYGAVTPAAAYLMACLGSALGLRCLVRTMRPHQSRKPGWLAMGAASIGCGIWTMHFIAMTGFTIEGAPIAYGVGLTVLSLVVAVAVVGVGVFVVGYYGSSPGVLAMAGATTGLGVAAMHYMGMAAMNFDGHVRYSATGVALSVLVAIAAAAAALWAAVSIRGFGSSLAASLVMGGAVTGMHYTGMAAASFHSYHLTGYGFDGRSPLSLLLPMLIGPVIFLTLAAVVVMFDPVLVTDRTADSRRRATAHPGSGDTSLRHDGLASFEVDLFSVGSDPHRQPTSGARSP
ncbi:MULTISPECIES: MHYT domain-containing protein [unclassified Streptomyces]|uniref:MHYT domain-containing protein n=1 Tax=unclassified Streptomyces TaxID=2593676 RepID=UPI003450C775